MNKILQLLKRKTVKLPVNLPDDLDTQYRLSHEVSEIMHTTCPDCGAEVKQRVFVSYDTIKAVHAAIIKRCG